MQALAGEPPKTVGRNSTSRTLSWQPVGPFGKSAVANSFTKEMAGDLGRTRPGARHQRALAPTILLCVFENATFLNVLELSSGFL